MKKDTFFRNIQTWLGIFILLALLLSPISAQAQGLSFPAEINKSFNPISISSGGVSRLSVTVYNPNSFQLTNGAWSDNLVGVQPGISIANPVNMTNTCGGTVTAVAGTTSLSLTGGTVPPQVGATPGSCTVEIDVTSTTPGNLINTIPAGGFNSTGAGGINITNTTPASATLQVGVVQSPTVSKSFTPTTVFVGQDSRLAITVRNTDLSTALTQASITDNLPAGVFLATPVSPTIANCGPAPVVTAVSGTSVVTLSNLTIAPNSSCTVRVSVRSNTSNIYNNTIPANAVQNQQGVTNGSPASAILNVQNIGLVKAFSPTDFQAGGTSTLTITLQNPTGTAYTGAALSDTLPVAPNTNLTVVPGSATTTCAGGTASITLPRTVNLTGGTIPPGTPAAPGTCSITVQVTAPAGASAATYTNTIPAGTLTTTQGASNIAPAIANVSVYATGTGVTGVKSFTPDTITAGDNSMMRILINAPADTNLTNFSITDNLPANVTVSNSTAPVLSGCGVGAALNAATGATSVSLTGGTILIGTACTIDVWVTSTTVGVHTNTIPPANITNNENRRPVNPLTDDLTVQPVVLPSDLSVSKVFTPPVVNPNGLSTLTITLQNTNTSPLINVSLSDPLPGGIANGVVVAPIPNAGTTCGAGVVTAAPGGKTVQLTNGTIPAQVGAIPGTCTISIDVQGTGSVAGHVNVIPVGNVTGTIQGTGTVISNPAPATARLDIANLSINVVKGFNPLTVFGGSASTMSLQLVNPNNALLTGIALTDNMPAGMIIANPPNFNVGTCGGTLTGVIGSNTVSFSGGSLPAASNCTLTLSVTMTVNGNLTNTIPAQAVTTFNGATNPQPAAASLTNLPGASVSKAFAPNPILAGGGNYSLLTITIQNTGNVSLTGMGLADTLPGALPAGLEIAGGAGVPAPVNNCGGTLTAVVGTQLIQLTNGSLAATSSCTIVVAVSSTVPGNYVNTIPAGALTNPQGATNTTPATANLIVTGNPSGLTKTITGTNQPFTAATDVAIGEIVTYQVTVEIPPGTYNNANLVDTLVRGLAFMGCDTITAPGLTTTIAGGFASICANPTVDDAGGGTPADIDRRITYDFGTLDNVGAANQIITVTYRAKVLDIPANVDGVSLNNSAGWSSSAGSIPPVQTTVDIIEPDMTIGKTANVGFIANGSTATFTLIVNHTAASNTDAFDVIVTDVLPTTVDFVAGSLDCDDGQQDPNVSCTYDPLTRTISAEWSTFTRLPVGDQGIIRFDVTGNATIPAGGSVTNVANVGWSSLPGNQTTPQSFSVPSNPFARERFYDPAALAPLYNSTSTLVLTPLGGGGGGGGGGGAAAGNNTADPDIGGFLIPVTGFTPNVVTDLDSASRPAYTATGLTMEIPVLKLKTSIVGVQLKKGDWDVSWLQDQAGWLNGTAYPTWEGNSVLTAHAVNKDGKRGIFSSLKYLPKGEYIFVYNNGSRYTYKVVSNQYVQPDDIKVLQHEEKSYITLITCADFDEKTGTYLRRVVVRAVLVDVREAE